MWLRMMRFWFRLGNLRVTVVYLGEARQIAGAQEEELELSSPANLGHAFSKAISIHPGLEKMKEIIRPLLNGQWSSETAELKDGDRITLLPPVGGG